MRTKLFSRVFKLPPRGETAPMDIYLKLRAKHYMKTTPANYHSACMYNESTTKEASDKAPKLTYTAPSSSSNKSRSDDFMYEKARAAVDSRDWRKALNREVFAQLYEDAKKEVEQDHRFARKAAEILSPADPQASDSQKRDGSPSNNEFADGQETPESIARNKP